MVLPDQPSSSSSSKSARDYVTPHKISLLVLVKEFCSVRQHSQTKRSLQKAEEISWEHNVKQNRDFHCTLLKLIQNPDMDLKRLMNIIHPVLHPKTYRSFIERLHNLRKNGISVIMDYIVTLDTLLVEPAPLIALIHKGSVIGLFIRHMLLAFDKLSFNLITKLFRKFHAYFDAAFVQCFDENLEIACADSPPVEDLEESFSEECQVFASQKQAEFFIAQQSALLQINESAALSPFDLQQKIRELMKGNPEIYEVCFLSYLNSLRVREYCGAKDNLYHHFDRNTTVPQECKASAVSEDLSRSSRYAALNLAIFHALFGHKEEALSALNEAIMVAQEVNDNVCLQYSLAWLYRLTSENKEILIERSIAKSAELGLWHLSSVGIQALTKLKSSTPAMPSSIFELLTKSDIQNCQHSMTDMLGSAISLRAGLWGHYGFSSLQLLFSEVLLYLKTSDSMRGNIYHIGEGVCLALRNLALEFACRGSYVNSTRALVVARDLFPTHSEHSHIWQLADLIIKFEKALFQSKWLKAQQTQKGIAIFDNDEGQLRKAQLLFYQGNLAEADVILKQLLDSCENKQISAFFYVRILLLRSELLSTTPNYIMALPLLMTNLAKCETYHLSGLLAVTFIHVAALQLELGLPKQGIVLLDQVYVSLLANGTFYDRGCCCFLYARCLAFSVIQSKNKNSEYSKRLILKAISMSAKALESFKAIKAVQKMKSVLFWQAYIYNYLGMKTDRNDICYRYRTIEDELT
ncbi:anaphase-promoting complex subunit 5 [Trichonephila clavata]|uniref:Anaphase-promoting complex subunit 5 n=1 Tax=Trichonephila clavata TaxID=2740835 RepID=A0A8X6HFJ5_TRICU|nr:anaphase-promoting complex subunit 5 [Trichonephila clavata]